MFDISDTAVIVDACTKDLHAFIIITKYGSLWPYIWPITVSVSICGGSEI